MEFNQLYHWHGLMPDSFIIQGEEYSYEQFLYNTSMLMDYGVEALVESFSKQVAGRVRSCSPLPASAGAVGPREGCSWNHYSSNELPCSAVGRPSHVESSTQGIT